MTLPALPSAWSVDEVHVATMMREWLDRQAALVHVTRLEATTKENMALRSRAARRHLQDPPSLAYGGTSAPMVRTLAPIQGTIPARATRLETLFLRVGRVKVQANLNVALGDQAIFRWDHVRETFFVPSSPLSPVQLEVYQSLRRDGMTPGRALEGSRLLGVSA